MLKFLSLVGLALAMAGAPMLLHAETPKEKIRVLIVTGGHDFEREPFFELFKSLPDVTFTEVRHPDAHKRFAPAAGAETESYQVADDFDVIVLYDLWQDIPEQAKKDFVSLLHRGKGLVALHHCIASYQKWPEYEKIVGGKYHIPGLSDQPESGFKHDCDMQIRIADPAHPVAAGVKDFAIHDEAYIRMRFSPDLKPLLTTDHPDNDPAVAWTRRYGNARVAYIQLGHDGKAYRNESYRNLVGNAIRWAACRLPEARPDEDGFISLFDGKTLDGWVLMGEPDGFFVKDGVIRSEGRNGRWLRSVRQYSDFVLKLEWRVAENGNSGVFIRANESGQPWLVGAEVQITNEPRDDLHCTGSLYGSVAPNPRPDESADKWHAFEIRCEGPRIAVSVDGVKVVDADGDAVEALKAKARRGYIGLQDSHAPKGCWIEYRNIRIKELGQKTKQAEGRSQKAEEDRRQETGVRSQETGGRSQKPEGRSRTLGWPIPAAISRTVEQTAGGQVHLANQHNLASRPSSLYCSTVLPLTCSIAALRRSEWGLDDGILNHAPRAKSTQNLCSRLAPAFHSTDLLLTCSTVLARRARVPLLCEQCDCQRSPGTLLIIAGSKSRHRPQWDHHMGGQSAIMSGVPLQPGSSAAPRANPPAFGSPDVRRDPCHPAAPLRRRVPQPASAFFLLPSVSCLLSSVSFPGASND